ncbi:MAG: hypothetical protein SFH39_03620 [Candidatus Magnetobacterium sp. LHC-1]|uniref:Secreted protein n=1 Tax=Candidatus Magnetobacterium casense TaxID=1455061 RepID=A0ABS6RVK3_9BACT|nr:hypothetical protein [Candidatus Magnetobacterium casensis]MBF0608450.1 hypothetical protein [Nitrospirota bacterium]MBV6340616.1 hypothetical protein [Candidatus Magnetobacterium casensis]
MNRLKSLYVVLVVALFLGIGSVAIGYCVEEAIGTFTYERVGGNGAVTKGIGNITVLDNNETAGALKPVYCISNKYIPSFYFTMDANMKKVLVDQYSAYWQDCGIAFYACDTATGCSTGTTPTPPPGPTPTPPPGPTPTPGPTPPPTGTVACTNGNVTDGTYSGYTASSSEISFTAASNYLSNGSIKLWLNSCTYSTSTITFSTLSKPVSQCKFAIQATDAQNSFTLTWTGEFSSQNNTVSGTFSYTDTEGCKASGSWSATKK